MGELDDIKKYIDHWQSYVDGQAAILKKNQRERNEHVKAMKRMEADAFNTKEAHEIFILAAAATQTQVKEFIEELVSLALQSVFGIEYSFRLNFYSRRGQVELEPMILWCKEEMSPRDSVGGGIVDVASFAMRLVLWALSPKRSSPVFILDEPFKFVSKDMTDAVASMLKSVASLLGIQIIMVSHDEGLIRAADRAWTVSKENGIAVVTPN